MAGVTAASERPSTREAPLAAVVIPAAGITEIGVGLSAAAIALDLAAAESDETAAGADGVDAARGVRTHEVPRTQNTRYFGLAVNIRLSNIGVSTRVIERNLSGRNGPKTWQGVR